MGAITRNLRRLMNPFTYQPYFRTAKSIARVIGGPGHLRKRSVGYWLRRLAVRAEQ